MALPKRPRIELTHAKASDIDEAFAFLEKRFPEGLAAPDTVKFVVNHNPDSIFLFWREQKIAGIYATLFLSPLGLEQLLLGEFDAAKPDRASLTTAGSVPAAIYNWLVIAPGLAAEGIQHVSQFLRSPKYRHVNLFSHVTTADGVAVSEKLGFEPIRCGAQGLYRYIRMPNRTAQVQYAA